MEETKRRKIQPNQFIALATEQVTYKGNCHCGFFKFSIVVPKPVEEVKTCRCAICVRKAYLWIVLPEKGLIWDVDGEGGEEGLSIYAFGEKEMDHKFCPKCGSALFRRVNPNTAPKNERLAINARILPSLRTLLPSMRKIPVNKTPPHFDAPIFPTPPSISDEASSIMEAYTVFPKPPGLSPEAVRDGMEAYSGRCHCGAVTFSFLSFPLEKEKIVECNCSLCSRNGELYIYPKTFQVKVRGKEHLTEYAFLFTKSFHSFCKTCGVSVLVRVLGEGEDITPINVRCLVPAVDIGKLEIERYDGWSQGREYVV